mmetsp:Transcript_34651/g.80901  ORF Transcript_34651/g.80901 Transcript_34651/m.80901 type:complete len:91 (+) Transcript_34651:870-1142(+)
MPTTDVDLGAGIPQYGCDSTRRVVQGARQGRESADQRSSSKTCSMQHHRFCKCCRKRSGPVTRICSSHCIEAPPVQLCLEGLCAEYTSSG